MRLRLDVNALDYALLAGYFAVVVGIGVAARRSIANFCGAIAAVQVSWVVMLVVTAHSR